MRRSLKRNRLEAITVVVLLTAFLSTGFLVTGCSTSVQEQRARLSINQYSLDIIELQKALERTKKFAVAIQAKINADLAAAAGKYQEETAVVQQRIAELEQLIEEKKRAIEAEEKTREGEIESTNEPYSRYYGSEDWKKAIEDGCCGHEE